MNLMKKALLLAILVGISAGPPVAAGETRRTASGSMFVTVQIGVNSFIAAADRQAEPFQTLPFPMGAAFELLISEHWGLGGTLMHDRWSDYLGLFCGKYSFRLFKPAFDVSYHWRPEKIGGLDLFAGASVGYSLLFVGNELGNRYGGLLKSEPHLAPSLGMRLHFWDHLPGFPEKISLTLRAGWSLAGRFSGPYGSVGVSYRIH